jgi:hypothetical protein
MLRRWLGESEEWGCRIFTEAPDGRTEWIVDSEPPRPGSYGTPDLASYDLVILGDIDPARLGHPDPFLEYLRAGGTLVWLAGPNHNPQKFQATAWTRLLPAQTFQEFKPGPPVIFEATAAGRTHPVCRIAETEAASEKEWKDLGAVIRFVRSERVKMETQVLAELKFEERPDPGRREPDLTSEPLLMVWSVGLGRALFIATDDLHKIKSMVSGRFVHKDLWRSIFQWARK